VAIAGALSKFASTGSIIVASGTGALITALLLLWLARVKPLVAKSVS